MISNFITEKWASLNSPKRESSRKLNSLPSAAETKPSQQPAENPPQEPPKQADTKEEAPLLITDGPYGSATEHVFAYDTVFLVGAGIGMKLL